MHMRNVPTSQKMKHFTTSVASFRLALAHVRKEKLEKMQ
jgi:hypothetical protein